ncbi:hypothetical protein ANN_03218 [Periplaneta americana]|uniref:Uncharacterized protein n=1 Tax=Periplaneta americana TaxID=6978 RepID=A0ABQ8U036_PERAM|nr:hypothetical protein ANN_03218 [Periplaneta americana]
MLEVKAKDFIATHQIRNEDVPNTDQSRFKKELHSGRILAESTGSISARTHSYMIGLMPVITMAEILLPHIRVMARPHRKEARAPISGLANRDDLYTSTIPDGVAS